MVSHFRRKASARQSLSFPQTANSKTKCVRPQNVSLSQSQLAVIISRFAIFTLLTISVYFPSSLAIICAPLGAFWCLLLSDTASLWCSANRGAHPSCTSHLSAFFFYSPYCILLLCIRLFGTIAECVYFINKHKTLAKAPLKEIF